VNECHFFLGTIGTVLLSPICLMVLRDLTETLFEHTYTIVLHARQLSKERPQEEARSGVVKSDLSDGLTRPARDTLFAHPYTKQPVCSAWSPSTSTNCHSCTVSGTLVPAFVSYPCSFEMRNHRSSAKLAIVLHLSLLASVLPIDYLHLPGSL
jgi:hypothetical protein